MDATLSATLEATKYEWLDQKGFEKILVALLKIINNTGASATYDDTAIKASVKANTDAINIINGTGEGSITKMVADAIASVVASAPESFDTLKEIADWINSHEESASAMNSKISDNSKAITNLQTLIGQLPETPEATNIIDYIQKYVDNKVASSEDMADVKSRLTTVESDVTELKSIKFGASDEDLDAMLQRAITAAATDDSTEV